MAKTVRPNTEHTSHAVASVAARVLNGKSLKAAEEWLHSIVMTDDVTNDADRQHALTLLGALTSLRTLAGSALTQRG